jgi:murein DD-endopeptidase MepM/ murein hydrolase activator NlpD
MRIRTGDVEQTLHAAGVTSKLNMTSSPLGGDFGAVRSQGHKNHQGWDLYAGIGTSFYAISGGTVVFVASHGDYGRQLCLKLMGPEIDSIAHRLGARHLYAFYGHLLSTFVFPGYEAKEGDPLGLTGNSGNARNTPPHLHFEIRREPRLGKGLHGRINPGEVIGYQYYQCRA